MSLIAVYRLDEEGNLTRNGSLGNEDALSVSTGTTSFAAGLLGNGMTAVGSAATISKTGGLQTSLAQARNFSIAIWVKYTGTPGSGSGAIQLRDASNVQLFLVSYSPNLTAQFNATIYGNVADILEGSFTSGRTPNQEGGTGIWHFVVVTWNNTTHIAKYYINGVLRATGEFTVAQNEFLTEDVTFDIDWQRLFVSARTNTIIDQLMIDDTEVDLATVQSWYNSGSGTDPSATYREAAGKFDGLPRSLAVTEDAPRGYGMMLGVPRASGTVEF